MDVQFETSKENSGRVLKERATEFFERRFDRDIAQGKMTISQKRRLLEAVEACKDGD